MAGNAVLLETINVVVPATQILIGLALFDSTLIYGILFLALAAFGAGRILGADRYIERLEIGDRTLIERYPKLRYMLG